MDKFTVKHNKPKLIQEVGENLSSHIAISHIAILCVVSHT